jgi:FAD/FMN-containing dehydrogenase
MPKQEQEPLPPVQAEADWSRRRFLGATVATAAAGAVAGWLPAFRVEAGSSQASCAVPPGFPSSIPLYQQAYQNWSEEIVIDALWTCAPRTPQDLVTLANWAAAAGYRLRPRGSMHGWAPLTVAAGSGCDTQVVLADTTQYLTAISTNAGASPPTVTSQAGATLDELLAAMETAGLGFTATPAPGDVTVGGMLAIDGHGTAVPAIGETRAPGQTYGSLSNRILSLTAVVWDPGSSQYVLRTFQRGDDDIRPLLTHLGRSLVSEVTLQAGANMRLRCQSLLDITAAEMFGPAGSTGRTLASFVDSAGRVEAIWYPFTQKPWLKVWSLCPVQPATAREVTQPYNYPFSDIIPEPASNLAKSLIEGETAAAPAFGQAQYDVTVAGLLAPPSYDLWGWSKNLLVYIRPSTLRVTANGTVVLTSRANIQQVVNDFYNQYQAQVAAYQTQGLYPINGPVEIRVSGLDQTQDVDLPGATCPLLSAIKPRPDHPEWDVAVWFDCLTFPGTANSFQFYAELEQWFYANYSGDYAMVRPEWSKGWAYTNTAGWANAGMLGQVIPAAQSAGQDPGDDFAAACAALDRYDPYRIFASPLLDALAP